MRVEPVPRRKWGEFGGPENPARAQVAFKDCPRCDGHILYSHTAGMQLQQACINCGWEGAKPVGPAELARAGVHLSAHDLATLRFLARLNLVSTKLDGDVGYGSSFDQAPRSRSEERSARANYRRNRREEAEDYYDAYRRHAESGPLSG